MEKKCRKCEITKPHVHYNKDLRQKKDGLSPICADCDRKRQAEMRHKRKEKPKVDLNQYRVIPKEQHGYNCRRCKVVKPMTEFPSSKSRVCTICCNERDLIYAAKQKEAEEKEAYDTHVITDEYGNVYRDYIVGVSVYSASYYANLKWRDEYRYDRGEIEICDYCCLRRETDTMVKDRHNKYKCRSCHRASNPMNK